MKEEQALPQYCPTVAPTCREGAVVEGRLLVFCPVKVFAGCCDQDQSEQLVGLQDGPHRGGGLWQRAHCRQLHLNKKYSE